MGFSGKIAIAGVHEYESRWSPDKTSFQIMGECAREALDDAGLTLDDVDGLFCATMTMGATNVGGFVGIGTPEFDAQGNITNGDDLFGFGLSGLDAGIGFFEPTIPVDGLPEFTAGKATATSLQTYGFGDYLEISATDIVLNLNNGDAWPGDIGPPVIDFATSFETSPGAADGVFEIHAPTVAVTPQRGRGLR